MQLPTYKLVRLSKNALLACQVASSHLLDDPVLLALQITRKLPTRLAKKTARTLVKIPGAGTQALGYQMLGHKDFLPAAEQLINQASLNRWQKIQKRIASEVAIGYGLIDWRSEQVPAVTRARAAWDSGAVSNAVQLAEEAGAKSYARRLRGEVQLLDPDFKLNLPQADLPEAKGLVALHLLTNSTPATQSGYTLRTQRLLNALADRGVGIEAFTRLGYPVMVGGLTALDTVQEQKITYRRSLPTRLAPTQPLRLEQWAKLVLKALKTKPSLVHTTTNYPNALVAQGLANALDIPWVYEARGVMEETWVSNKKTVAAQTDAEKSERFILIRNRETQLMHAADHLVTLSQTMKDLFVARGVAAEKITVVPNAVEENLFELNLTSRQARAQLGLDESGFWVGSVSSLVYYEGFDTLLEAVAQLRKQGQDIRLLLAGDGVARPALEELHRRLAAETGQEFAVFLGKLSPENAYTAHQALDLFVVPRRDDRVCRSVTPLKPIEAMALNRAVLMSDIPPLAELVHNGITEPTGRLAVAEDPASFASAISELAQDDAARETYAAAGREFARTRTWARNAEILENLYARLIKERSWQRKRA